MIFAGTLSAFKSQKIKQQQEWRRVCLL